jgi:hypothetical protein
VDDASNASLGSQSASAKDESKPLLTPDNNALFDNVNVALAAGLGENVALAGRKDEWVDDDDVAHATGLGDDMALAGGQEVNTPFDDNVAPPGGHDHTVACAGGLGDNPLHATQASPVNPRVAPAARISPDEIFCCLRQILTKLDNKLDASTLTMSIQQTIANSVEKVLDGSIQQMIATSIEKKPSTVCSPHSTARLKHWTPALKAPRTTQQTLPQLCVLSFD